MASGDKFYIADKDTLDEVKGKIGSTTDTGGSSTAGSVFGKLNYLVSQLQASYIANIYSWCSALISRIGSNSDVANSAIGATAHGKLNWFLNLFGKTDDTGGSTTAGTVMAKENAILNKIGLFSDKSDLTVFGKLNALSSNLSSKLACCGDIGTTFSIKDTKGYFAEILVEITENSILMPSGYYVEFVDVPLSIYDIIIKNSSISVNSNTVTIDVDTLGKIYTFEYYILTQKFINSGTYTFPVKTMYITAAGCGGGGGGASSSNSTGAGGGGGGGGACIHLAKYTKSVGFSTDITITNYGGSGGNVNTNGIAGNPTILSNLITLAGGGAGGAGSGYDRGSGGLNGSGGGAGGSKNSINGTNSIIPTGKGGSGDSGCGGGGGYGVGGAGGAIGGKGSLGGFGAGGGGGGSSSAGGNAGAAGGGGIVEFYIGYKI